MKAQTAMATVPVSDLERARSFYEHTVGLEPQMVDDDMGAVIYKAGDSRIFVYRTQAHSGDATVVSIWLEDLDDVARDLQSKGVSFEEFEMPGAEWHSGIAGMSTPTGDMRSAWFKDPDGNVIAIGEGKLS